MSFSSHSPEKPDPPGRAAGSRFRVAIGLLSVPQRATFLVLTLARIAVGVCDLAVAAAMYFLFLLIQGNQPSFHLFRFPSSSLSVAVVAAALVILRTLLDLASTRSVLREVQKLYIDLLLRLARGYSRMQWSRFVQRNRSELFSHALSTARAAADFYLDCVELVAAVAIVLIMSAAIVDRSPAAAACFALALGAFYLLHRFAFRARLQAASVTLESSLRSLRRNLADMLSSGREIRSYGNHAFFHSRIERPAQAVAASSIRVALLPQIPRAFADQGAVLLFLSLIIAAQLRHGSARQLLPLLAFYFVLSRRLIPLMSQISLVSGQIEGAYQNVGTVDLELQLCRANTMESRPAEPPRPGLVLQLERVSFFFRKSVPIFRDVTLSMRNGEIVVLRGVSGCGKSSLLNLIAGVTEPCAGAVRLDRSGVGYVPQEVILLDDSIRNNLLFGLSPKTDLELMHVLALARLDDFVASQPLGLDAAAGDNGVLFSGGQRQRLGLARALLRGCRLLLLDEATSALDLENEERILSNLSRSGVAVLLVTHRAQTHRFAHRVLHLESGRLVEDALADHASNQPSLVLRIPP